MARIPPDISNCVAFVGSRGPDGKPVLRGTVFFICRSIGSTRSQTVFAVTARHVLDRIRESGQQGCFRLTLGLDVIVTGVPLNNSIWLNFELSDWVDHPDPTVDAAVMHMPILDMLDMRSLPPDAALTRAIIDEESVGEGEEVFMVGLFANRPGVQRNVPIVRVGNIAAMPREKIYSPVFGYMDAYLVEARSIGGLSGSPTFVHLGVARVNTAGRLVIASKPEGALYWMGLVHGHYDGGLTHLDEILVDARDTQREKVNVGIAVVVPAERILEIFEHPKLKGLDEQLVAALPTYVDAAGKESVPTSPRARELPRADRT